MRHTNVLQCPECDDGTYMEWESATDGSDRDFWVLVCPKCDHTIYDYEPEQEDDEL